MGMKNTFLLSILVVTNASSQYSGQVQDLSDSQLDTLKNIFGNSVNDVYSQNTEQKERQTSNFEDGTNGVEVIVQVVKNEDGYVAPDDYKTQVGSLTDKATITDGGGLIDVRNGFGILSPEDSKCEGFLDVC